MLNRASKLADLLTPEAVKRARVLRAYRDVFDSPQGRVVLNDLAAKHGLLATSFARASESETKAIDMAFAEGERNAILGILHSLSIDWDQFQELTKEEAYYED